MAKEKSGYNIKCKFTPTGQTQIVFNAKSKTLPGITGVDKIDLNTDGTGELKEFAPGDQYELTDPAVTVIDDFDLFETLRGYMNDPGELVFESNTTNKRAKFPNAWIKEVKRGGVDLNGNPTIDITFALGGGASGVPSVETITP